MRTGFLSTEDTEAPGNFGLLDQSLGLKYVENVLTGIIAILLTVFIIYIATYPRPAHIAFEYVTV